MRSNELTGMSLTQWFVAADESWRGSKHVGTNF
jgi:hypothetical protein